jgi:hypothetical protein
MNLLRFQLWLCISSTICLEIEDTRDFVISPPKDSIKRSKICLQNQLTKPRLYLEAIVNYLSCLSLLSGTYLTLRYTSPELYVLAGLLLKGKDVCGIGSSSSLPLYIGGEGQKQCGSCGDESHRILLRAVMFLFGHVALPSFFVRNLVFKHISIT